VRKVKTGWEVKMKKVPNMLQGCLKSGRFPIVGKQKSFRTQILMK